MTPGAGPGAVQGGGTGGGTGNGHVAGGSGTLVRHADPAAFDTGLRPFFAYRDLGIAGATAGRFGANVIRAVPGRHAQPAWHTHALGFQLVYVLRGWVRFEYEDIGEVLLEAGSSAYQPPGVRHREVGHSDDLEMLEVTAPAEFQTAMADAPG